MKRISIDSVDREHVDFLLLVVIILLVGVGLSALFTASYSHSERIHGDPLKMLTSQLLFLGLGLLSAYFAARVPLAVVKKIIPLLLVFTFSLMVMTFVPGIGLPLLGARRWILVFGYSFQPSELLKLTCVLYLAYMLSKNSEHVEDLVNAVLPPLLIVLLFVGLVYLQNDFSTAVFLFMLCMLMFFLARVPFIYFIMISTSIASLSLILLFTKEHRVHRLISFLRPDLDPLGTGYQVMTSLSAVASGGIWGLGFGNGVRKLGGLPEAHSDFIFAVVAEEAGLLGVVFVFCLLFLFAARGFFIAFHSRNGFEFFLAFGLTTSILFQSLFNIAVVVGVVPTTGIPLPFFSSGGSSIVITMIMCGLLLNVSRSITGDEENSYE